VVRLVTFLDPRIPGAEAGAARAKVDELLTALVELPDYGNIARISDGQSWRLMSGKLDPQHCYSYRPNRDFPANSSGCSSSCTGTATTTCSSFTRCARCATNCGSR